MINEFYTIKHATYINIIEIKVKKSRFIASIKHTDNETSAINFINEIKKENLKASHNVFAYIIRNEKIQKCSDDGEPSGTAGIPVLEIIKKSNLQDITIVITRYFGGVLLGASGLIRAYSKSAKTVIESMKIISRVLCIEASIQIRYNELGKVQNELIKSGYDIKEIKYEDKIRIFVNLPIDEKEDYKEYISELGNGKLNVQFGSEYFINKG